jgi:hypothetical protein
MAVSSVESGYWKEIFERLTRIESRQEDLSRQLFGNGQAGKIQSLEVEIEHISTRIKLLEATESYRRGVTAVIGAITGAIVVACAELVRFLRH